MPESLVIPRPEDFEAKRSAIYAAKAGKTCLVVDFDRTVTRAFTETGANAATCYGIVESFSGFTDEYKQKIQEIFEKYFPIEIDPKIPVEEKIPVMHEWHGTAHNLMLTQNLCKADLAACVRDCPNFAVRDGAWEVFRLAKDLGMPMVVFSAGLGNVIREVLDQQLPTDLQEWSQENVHIVSNMLLWNDEGKLAGFSEPLIHVFNKNLREASDSLRAVLKGRDHVILAGDSMGDLSMADGLDAKVVVKFGWLNSNVEGNLDRYSAAFDHIVTNDGTMHCLVDFLKQLPV
mmetsp:Transcript_13016/g.29583  ORF Transcript_13016/g.29583 Transcript_13016/m.29583 type:complete len:289 (-) Transcript_13016:68-934(-)